ncbi:hypothetical protein HY771_02435 [Candidatus Uhrbacteria bacterium]|nr:hypothetical protein [Candidatus Uhrbacteria bacterium]
MKNKFYIFLILILPLLLFSSPVLAQTDDVENTEDAENTEYEGFKVEEPTEVPSGFGLFMRSMRERLSLTFTFNPDRRAERAMKFAEERMLIAEKMFEQGDGEELRLRARRMLEIAKTMMDRSQDSEDEALEDPDEETERLLRNRVRQFERHRAILDRLEEKVSEETRDEILNFREEMAARARRLENAIQNENIPEEIREHLEDVKERIEAHALEIREHVEEAQALRERAEQGDDEAAEELEELEERRREMIEKKIEEAQEMMERRREMIQEQIEEKIELEQRRREAAEEAEEVEEAEE